MLILRVLRMSVLAAASVVAFSILVPSAPAVAETPALTAGQLQKLARCIKSSGAKFYGAHWCGYCKRQKSYFGSAASSLPYIECSPSGSKTVFAKCAGISGFPTWVFADGNKASGALSPEKLAQKSGCTIEAPAADNPFRFPLS